MKSELTFFQSLSSLFQLTYFVKCKRTLLELNFYQPYPSSQWERKFCHCFYVVVVRWRQRNIVLQKSVINVQSCCFALSSYCFFTLSSPLHLKLPIIYDTLWSIRNRIFSVQIKLLLLIVSETFFDSSVVPSFLVRKAWWTNRATVARS